MQGHRLITTSRRQNKFTCNHLIAQTLWKKTGPPWRCPHDTLAIIPNVQDDRTNAWHRGVRDASLNTHLQSFDSPIPIRRTPLIGDAYMTTVLKTSCEQPFLNTKLAIEWARRLEITRNLV